MVYTYQYRAYIATFLALPQFILHFQKVLYVQKIGLVYF